MNASITLLLAAGIVAAILWVAARLDLHDFLLDHPNTRSLHARPIPRFGGVAIAIAAIVLLSSISAGPAMPWILLAALFLAAVSLVDDRRPLPVSIRLTAHIGASLLAAFTLATAIPIPDSAAAVPTIAVLATAPWIWCLIIGAIVWMTNLYNFMDGADGLAGGMTCIGFAAYAFAAAPTADSDVIVRISLVMTGAAAGFLLFNFPPATVFMGDSGSIPIGFLAGTVGVSGVITSLWSWWFPPLVFSAFIIDATVTLMRRLIQGKKLWHAHRDHYYQRLILAGWSHRKTTLSYYFLMLSSTVSALLAQNSQLSHAIVTFWVITYALLLVMTERWLAKNKKVKPEEIQRAI